MIKFIDFKQISRYRTAEDSPGFLLWRTYFVWKRKIEACLAPHDLTHIQFVLLAAIGYLAKDGALVAQNNLAKFTGCDVTMTSQVLRGLEKKGLIKRIQKAGDERAKYPQITQQGLSVLKAAMNDVETTDEQFFAPLKNDERFIEFLRTLLV